MLISADGNPRENNRVFPFGEPWLSFAASNNSEKFTTYQRDDASGEAGLDYAMARYYASRSGRFMTPDPGHVGANVSDPQSWNAYTYVLNDPINLIDPRGLHHCPKGYEADTCITVEAPLEWVPCFSIETGEPTGECGGGADIGIGGIGQQPGVVRPPRGVYPELEDGDGATARNAIIRAREIANDRQCNLALDGRAQGGIRSIAELLMNLTVGPRLAGGNVFGTVFDGRASIHRHVSGVTVRELLGGNGNIGATTGVVASRVVFLGEPFFNPARAGVRDPRWYVEAQAFILIHESVHAFGGFGDETYGNRLTNILVDACFPALANSRFLGGLYQ
jgi:RHS repeat-associated protein